MAVSFRKASPHHPWATRLRRSPWTSALLDGVNIAALSLMAGVLFQLGQNALIDVLPWAIRSDLPSSDRAA